MLDRAGCWIKEFGLKGSTRSMGSKCCAGRNLLNELNLLNFLNKETPNPKPQTFPNPKKINLKKTCI